MCFSKIPYLKTVLHLSLHGQYFLNKFITDGKTLTLSRFNIPGMADTPRFLTDSTLCLGVSVGGTAP